MKQLRSDEKIDLKQCIFHKLDKNLNDAIFESKCVDTVIYGLPGKYF